MAVRQVPVTARDEARATVGILDAKKAPPMAGLFSISQLLLQHYAALGSAGSAGRLSDDGAHLMGNVPR